MGIHLTEFAEVVTVIGEPGLMPGQGGTVDALRSEIIANRAIKVGARGLDAVGLELPGALRVVTGSGKPQYTSHVAHGTCTFVGFAYDTITDNGIEYDWERIDKRIDGINLDNPAGPLPSPLDNQQLTVVLKLTNPADDSVVFWPLWNGYARRLRRGRDEETGRDVYAVSGVENVHHLGAATLDPRWLSESSRAFAQQHINNRIDQILERIAYLDNNTNSAYKPNALITSDRWDTFLPRRTRRGLSPAGGASTLGAGTVVPELEPITGGAVSAQSMIHKLALVAGGQLVYHNGIGPIRDVTGDNRRVQPDTRDVPALDVYPAATVQIDWGGQLNGIIWPIDDRGQYQAGGMETPIVMTDGYTTDAWSGSYVTANADSDGQRTINVARMSGINADGSEASPATSFVFETSKEMIRKYGIRELHETGLPIGPGDSELARALNYARIAGLASDLLKTLAVPRPHWEIEQVDERTWEHYRVAAALQVHHRFSLRHGGATDQMTVTQVTNDISADGGAGPRWLKRLHCVPEALVPDDDEPRLIRPRKPASYDWDSASAAPAPSRPAPSTDGDEQTGARALPTTLPLPPVQRPEAQVRAAWTGKDKATITWDWPRRVGSAYIVKWVVEIYPLDENGGVDFGASTSRPGVGANLIEREVAHPWQTHYEHTATGAQRKGIRVGVNAVTRLDTIHSMGTVTLRPAEPPTEVHSVVARRTPNGGVAVAWAPPTDQGGSVLAYYRIRNAAGQPIAGKDRQQAGVPFVWFSAAQAAAAAWPISIEANNFGRDQPASDWAEVTLPPSAAPPAATSAGPGIGPDFLAARYSGNWLVLLWGHAATGTNGLAPANLEVRLTELGVPSPRVYTVESRLMDYSTGWVLRPFSVFDGLTPHGRDYKIEARVGNGTARGALANPSPWVEQAPLTGGNLGPTAVRDLALTRTSAIRESSDGLLATWRAPARPSEWPTNRIDELILPDPPPASAFARAPVAADPASSSLDGNFWGAYDTRVGTTEGVQGWGDNDLLDDTSVRTSRTVRIAPRYTDLTGDPVSLARRPISGPGPVQSLIATRETPNSNTVRFAFEPPVPADDGQPAEYRVRAGTGAWGAPVKLNTRLGLTGRPRPPLPAVAVTATATTIEVQTRTEGGQWGASAFAAVPAAAEPRSGGGTPGAPGGLRVCWWDAHIGDSGGGANSDRQYSSVASQTPAVQDAWAMSLVIFWDPPTTGGAVASYLARLEHPYTGFPVIPGQLSTQRVGGLLQTGTPRTWCVLPFFYWFNTARRRGYTWTTPQWRAINENPDDPRSTPPLVPTFGLRVWAQSATGITRYLAPSSLGSSSQQPGPYAFEYLPMPSGVTP